jgi:hypothetical protein
MPSQPKILPKLIESLAEAVYPSLAMLAGMELDLFTPLGNGPRSAEEIATAAGTDQAKTAELLHALVATGLLTYENGRFSNSPESNEFLVRGKPNYIGMRHHAYRRRWNSVLGVTETIRSGVPQRGMDYAGMPAEARDAFYRGTFTECLAAGWQLAASEDFSACRTLIDIGGGSGGVAIAMAERWPNLSVTIADLPANEAVARRFVDEAGLSDRIHVRPTDVVKEPLGGPYDAGVMRGLFPVLNPVQIRSVLANAHAALRPGSPLYVVGWILDDSKASPLLYATMNLVFVNDYADALSHTEAVHRAWLEQADFDFVRRKRTAATYGADFILARKRMSKIEA